MTQPRSQLVPHGASGTYHCVQRCVRRAFLCGVDRYTGQSFEHRKAWRRLVAYKRYYDQRYGGSAAYRAYVARLGAEPAK